jgi:hypothetical protein
MNEGGVDKMPIQPLVTIGACLRHITRIVEHDCTRPGISPDGCERVDPLTACELHRLLEKLFLITWQDEEQCQTTGKDGVRKQQVTAAGATRDRTIAGPGHERVESPFDSLPG